MPTVPTPVRKTVTRAEFDDVKHRLAELNAMIEELRRKSRGTTGANAKVARLESEVKAIRDQLLLNGERFNSAEDTAVKEAVSTEIARLNKRIQEFYDDINTQLKSLRTTVEEHTGILSEHGTRLVMVEEGQTSLHQRVELIATSTGSAGTPGWQIGLSLIVGFIAAWIWKSQNFIDNFTVQPNNRVVTIPYTAANSLWTSVFVGVAVAAITLGILLIFTGGRRTSNEEVTAVTRRDEVTTTTPRPETAAPITTTVPPEPAANPTPTEVLDRTEPGVQTGARS